ncbi:ABC transporter ATP-binding protein [Acutalibacter intestini]|uniref:ABC transporter ATP-binding protein n=1 Tax=Acutalibacter intestini TaxID=3093659 RepID=UPI002AC9BC2F|nr:ABC transporter ATP-binding protein [Acutalibacter sp. M00204]
MAIQLQNVVKRFGQVQALKGVGVVFEENRIYGLLGRNGAGKSTLLNILTNRIFPDGGTVLVDGENGLENDRAQSKIFLMSESTLHPDAMRVNGAFRWAQAFYPSFDKNHAMKLLGDFGLPAKAKISGLSTGYRSIFKLILALSVNVPYVLLDEPVLGLDANHRELFYKRLLEKYGEEPFTVVLSTHLIEEVANLVEDVVIIKEGEVLRQESRETMLAGGYTVSGGAAAVETYIQGKKILGVDALGGLRTAYVLGVPDQTGEAAKDLEFGPMDLQKMFIQLTNS